MRIGIDIDGVLADDDTYRLDTITKYCFENHLPDLDNPYEYESKCNWTEDIEDDYRDKYYFDYVKNVPARNYAAQVIQKLKEEGNEIIIITGRYKTKEESKIGNQMRCDTVNWLEKNHIVYDEICYATCPKSKEIKEKQIDLMIDDNPEVLKEAIKITKVFCFDNRYNTELNEDHMVRVFSWYDIYRKIQEMEKRK